MKNRKNVEEGIIKLFSNPDKLTQVIQAGIKQALLKHKQAGNAVCEWVDNQVVWIPPEKISVSSNKIKRLDDKEGSFEK